MTTRWYRHSARSLIFLLPLLLPLPCLAAEGSAGTGGTLEPRVIVEMPTAGMLAKGTYAIDASLYQEGGMLVGFSAGLLDRLAVGISYGGSGLIGTGDPVMNEVPGFFVKVRVLEESVAVPALALGFDSQGQNGYLKDLDRYVVKSPGFYAVLSKNYTMLGYLSIHGGVNYSLERADDDRDMNFFAGAEKTLGPFASVVLEYNLGMNDSDNKALGRGRGYLNTSLNLSPGSGLTISIGFKDMLKNGREGGFSGRTLRIEFVSPF